LGDHGEKEHGFFIYQDTLHVPLIVRLPNGRVRGGQIGENVSLVDVLPTVLSLLGIDIPKRVEGVDLSSDLVETRRSGGARLLYSESLWPELYNCCPLYGILDGTWKYIQSCKPELYDLSRDGGEKVNLVDKQPQTARRLRGRLEEWQKAMAATAKPPSDVRVPLGKDTLRQLESLGYVGGGTAHGDAGSDLRLEDPKDFVAVFERCKTSCYLLETHRNAEAKKELIEVVSLRPRLVLARYWLGEIALKESHPAEAIQQLSTALSILSESRDALTSSAREAKATQAGRCHMYLGRALIMDEKLDQAIVEYETALRVDPSGFEDHLNLVKLLAIRRRFREAVARCQKTLDIAPQNASIRNELAWMLATCPEASVRNGAKAIEIAQSLAQRSQGQVPEFLDTLAAAYAEARHFPEAVTKAEQALAVAKSTNQPLLVDKIRSRLDLYRAGRPYRDGPQSPSLPAARK
jgi:tetratricopeptide (TPR) repeat protein